ncbi:MAG: epoxyqueuosine reductase [Oscillospiraceae bacterium]|nr:epoxyqueuosine reductase [Oscillospiraceae bacterium]
MTREKLQKLIDDFCDNSPTNYLGRDSGADADANNYAKNNLQRATGEAPVKEDFGKYDGMKFFGHSVFSVCRADAPGFMDLKRPEVVGKHHFVPADWMPEARSVISFFLPYSRSTVEANKEDPNEPAMEWLYTRVDGQKYLLALGAMIRDALIEDGHKAVTPYTEDRFIMQVGPNPAPGTEHVPQYSSNWSERHVGMVSGLGTFGLSTNFISRVGCAGRLVSVVTDWDVEPDVPDYDDWLGYCNRCGACVRRCPAQAHFPDRPGKDHSICGGYIGKTCAKYTPRYGCGKCQSGIPCEYQPRRPEQKA